MNKTVFEKRIENFKTLMEQDKIDCLIATPGTNFYYISGIDTFRQKRLVAFVIPLKDRPFIICPAFEVELLKSKSFIDNFYPWDEEMDPFELLGKIIKKDNNKNLSLGIEPTTYFETFINIKKHFPESDFKDTGELFSSLRIKKSPEEINAVRKAVDITEKNIKNSLKELREGISEEEFKVHLTGPEKLVQFGPTSSYPHASGGKRTLEKNDVVLIDKSDICDKYLSDITRTGYFGKPPEEFLKIWHIVSRARDRAIEKCAPGVPCEEVDKGARDVIEKEGYGEYFIHRTGHGLGIDIHEPPYIVKGNRYKLEPGNLFTIEPGIYLPGKFGVRIEENVVITEEGCEVLSKQPSEPEIITARSL